MKICASLFVYLKIKFYDEEEILTASISYKQTNHINYLSCHTAIEFKITEHPTEEDHVFVLHDTKYPAIKFELYKISTTTIDHLNVK